MAVYAGLERDVKGRLLGFTPHILLRQTMEIGEGPMENWQEMAEKAKSLPRVQSATAFVSDNVIIDYESWQRPVMFRGIDTSDAVQVEGIARMLDLEAHPDSTADLGIDDRVVVSSVLADQLGLRVGDSVRLYSTRNFEEVMRVYRATEKPPLREAYADDWNLAVEILENGWSVKQGAASISVDQLSKAYELIAKLSGEGLRAPEHDLLTGLMLAMEAAEKDEAAGVYRVDAATRKSVADGVDALQKSDAEKMDGEALKGLKSIVLPKEVTVAGVYLASQMAVTPELFVPLPLAQDLAGLGEGVQGISLRLDDAYAAEQVAADSRDALGFGWSLLTWGAQYQTFFALINQQRVMMYFALSFIVLVSAFSMMAVMFTVTIQKRREIGVMKALGAAPGQIVRVFLYQGMILGFLGAILGVALGRLVIHFRGPIQGVFRSLGFDPFAASFTGFGILPAHHNISEQVVIAVMAFVLCSLAAWVPAVFAARSDAAKSLRNL
ncbi:MAG: hypothetical protein RIR37_1210, partial [Verrucomicrobiota bacterium]